MRTRRPFSTLLLAATLATLAVALPAGPVAADPVPPGTPTAERCFVEKAHTTFLDRSATGPELTEWTEAFVDGTPHHVLVRELARSDEWLAVTVTGIYELALERPPEPDGLAYWVGELRDGALVNRIGAQIFGSSEFYGIAGGTDEGFVEALYDRILDRAPDADGLAFWVGQVEARGRGGVASEFYVVVPVVGHAGRRPLPAAARPGAEPGRLHLLGRPAAHRERRPAGHPHRLQRRVRRPDPGAVPLRREGRDRRAPRRHRGRGLRRPARRRRREGAVHLDGHRPPCRPVRQRPADHRHAHGHRDLRGRRRGHRRRGRHRRGRPGPRRRRHRAGHHDRASWPTPGPPCPTRPRSPPPAAPRPTPGR